VGTGDLIKLAERATDHHCWSNTISRFLSLAVARLRGLECLIRNYLGFRSASPRFTQGFMLTPASPAKKLKSHFLQKFG
jgi:hypothetical protein